jgi:hypothetical protein
VESGAQIEDVVATLKEGFHCEVPEETSAWKEPQQLLPPIQLQSTVRDPIGIPVDLLADDAFANGSYLLRSWCQSAGVLLIAAHARAKDAGHAAASAPTWEFLFHCRNAAAHGNKLTFKNGQPRHPASWRGRIIDLKLEGSLLFAERPSDSPFLKPLDPILLLWDLEQSNAEMRARI